MGGGGTLGGADADDIGGEHDVGEDRAADAAGHLGGQIGQRGAPGQATKGGIDEGHHGVEVAAADGAEDENDRVKAGGRRGGVFQQLQADVAR